jgi:hypothetical protein
MKRLLGPRDRLDAGTVTRVPAGVGDCSCALVVFEDSDAVFLDTCDLHTEVTTASI